MKIIKTEVLEFSAKELDAMQLVIEICVELMREATNPNLKELAKNTYEKLAELWGWEE